MAFLTQEQIADIGFKHVGRDVRISSRAVFYEAHKMSIGDYSRVDDYCVVSGSVTIGRNVHIAVFCNVAGGEQGVEFGDFSGLAYSVNVFSQSDDYSGATLTNPTVPDEYKNVKHARVAIGRHAIVGAGSIVFPGVELAEGTSVGAMSVVAKSTEPWGIYVGIPARRVKDRAMGLLEHEAAYLASESVDADGAAE